MLKLIKTAMNHVMIFFITCIFSMSVSISLYAQPIDTSPASAIRQHKQKKIFLVDIRSKQKFNTIRIPGSINMPLHAVKTKPFLKARPIILINEGYAITLLEQECRDLNQKGFKASYLKGGLNGWHIKKGPIEGNLFAMKNIQLVPSQIVVQEMNTKNHIFIDISENRSSQYTLLFPDAIHMPELTTAKEAIKGITQITPKSQTLLIFNQNGKGYDHIMKTLSDQDIGPVFFLEGGLSDYDKFMNHLALSRQSKEARMKSVNKCSACRNNETKDKE